MRKQRGQNKGGMPSTMQYGGKFTGQEPPKGGAGAGTRHYHPQGLTYNPGKKLLNNGGKLGYASSVEINIS